MTGSGLWVKVAESNPSGATGFPVQSFLCHAAMSASVCIYLIQRLSRWAWFDVVTPSESTAGCFTAIFRGRKTLMAWAAVRAIEAPQWTSVDSVVVLSGWLSRCYGRGPPEWLTGRILGGQSGQVSWCLRHQFCLGSLQCSSVETTLHQKMLGKQVQILNPF